MATSATSNRNLILMPSGILEGLALSPVTEAELRGFTQSSNRTGVRRISFYQGQLKKAIFQGLHFTETNFARVEFEEVTFSRCKFERVDFTRAKFKNCSFSDCDFIKCDPYYASFKRTEIDPSCFRRCFASHSEWNKALILFSNLRLELRRTGETRFSRTAEYYFRVWQRRRLYHRWHFKRVVGFKPYISSLCLGALTGYGERPGYLAAWAFVVISFMSFVYMEITPYVLPGPGHPFVEYWYYSFRVFFAQGFTAGFQTYTLIISQLSEFTVGLVLVGLLIGSIARKLSP